MTDFIKTKLEAGVFYLEMNRPDKKNALTLDMYETMANYLAAGDDDPEIKCFLISGIAGCFTSGNDVEDFLKNPPSDGSSPVVKFLNALLHTQKPIVAAVSGVAVGIGTTMLLHCDLVYADKEARFQTPFVNLGLCPEAASSLLLREMVGHQKASELLLLGEMFDVNTASDLGFVNEVVDCAYVKASEVALKLAEKPPTALRISKKLIKESQTQNILDAMGRENRQFMPLLAGPEAKEALMAFMQKRKPDWSNC